MLHDVEAVVLVGGKGTRLRPLTLSAPKPMLPTAGVPFLAHLLSRIRDGGRPAGRARHLLPGRDVRRPLRRRLGARAWRSSTSSRTSRWAPAAASATSPSTSPRTTCWSSTATCWPAPTSRAVVDTHRRTKADVTLHLVRVPDPRAFGCVPTDADGPGDGVPGEDRRPADRPDQRRLLRLPPRGDRVDPRGPAGVGRAGDVPGAARVGRAGLRVTSTSRTGATWAPRWTSCAARPTWSAASRRRPRCPVRPASRWSSTAREIDPTARGRGRHDGRPRA